MSLSPSYRALVVDDEAIARKMLAFSLQQEGFVCDLARDGMQASDLIAEREYDLVVTDLLMPHKHGHSLAVDLLLDPERPVLIVHTSVDDPRLTKDLLIRGVDDIVYKPTNYATFAARAAALGAWESWDVVEFPLAAVLTRLRIRSVKEIIVDTQIKIEQLTTGSQSESRCVDASKQNPATRPIGYWKSSWHAFDFLAAVCPALGVEPLQSDTENQSSILANCLENESSRRIDNLKPREGQDLLVVTTESNRARFAKYGYVVALPTTFRRLQNAVGDCCAD